MPGRLYGFAHDLRSKRLVFATRENRCPLFRIVRQHTKRRSEAGMAAAVLADIGGRALVAEIGGRAVPIGKGAGDDAGAVIVEVADLVGQAVPVAGAVALWV